MMRSLLIKIYQSLLSHRELLFKIAAPFLAIRSFYYRGQTVECPCCAGKYRTFLPFGVNQRPQALCPGCLSLERHRLLWLYLTQKTNILTQQLKVLHIAPEYILKKKLQQLPNLDYITADIRPYEMVQMDITKIPYPDNSFDVILCSHVLEHIPDDQTAMQELCRVLKPNGWGILQVPIAPNLATTLEGTPDLSSQEREKLFGHHDHQRIYGQDYQGKLEKAGFLVKVDPYPQQLGEVASRKFGLTAHEEIYYCTPH